MPLITNNLSQTQEKLINLLIYFDSLSIQDNKEMRRKLYDFFFVWKSNGQPSDELESALPKQLKESEIERVKFLQL